MAISPKYFFSVVLLILLSRSTLSEMLYVQDHVMRVGADTALGCAITHISYVGNNINLINSFDLGREVQASFYSGPQHYENCEFRGQAWSWNPIGCGDRFGNPSQILDARVEGNAIICKIIPMQWACNNIPCECSFEMRYTVGDGDLSASVTLDNHRSDKTDYGPYPQEMPAIYTNGILYRIMGYQGDQPWTNAPLSEWDGQLKEWWIPGKLQGISENWLALVAKDGFALGVYTTNSDRAEFHAGFSGNKKGKGGPKDSQTGYMAPIGYINLPADVQYTYTYRIIIGNVNDIRARVYSLHNAGQISGKYMPEIKTNITAVW